MKKALVYFVIFAAVLVSVTTKAQERGKVEVIKDPRVDTLIARRLTLRATANNGGPVASVSASTATTAYGYRLQIFSGSGRKEAYDAMAKFQAKYPDLRTYISYNEPNFKVQAGDFRTRLEAEKLKADLKNVFTGLFIIPEKINIPKAAATPNEQGK